MPRGGVADAFGKGSPNWNLPFPPGNLTAAEIVAYFPHWLKSVDVIDRFIMNGGSAQILADMLTEFRELPGREPYPSNSVYIMMKDAMRRAGFDNWSVNLHRRFTGEREWDPSQLTVTSFRVPRLTHPKAGISSRNIEASPILFRDLTRFVKRAPTEDDALDLTPCVIYASNHQQEDWYFPSHFAELVNHLGGPKRVTTAHWDNYAFSRRCGDIAIVPLQPYDNSPALTPTKETRLLGTPSPSSPLTRTTLLSSTIHMTRARTTSKDPRETGRKSSRLATLDNHHFNSDSEDNSPDVVLKGGRRSTRLAIKAGMTGVKEMDISLVKGNEEGDMNQRRSNRLRNKPSMNFCEDSELDTPTSKGSVDKNWAPEKEGSPTSEDEPINVDEDDLDLENIPAPRQIRTRALRLTTERRAAKLAMRKVHAIQTPTPPKQKITKKFAPEVEAAARNFRSRQPVFLKPLPISRDRVTIDAYNVALFAEDGATDLWGSALSSSRFGGPRRHPPWRELYRLTDPENDDASDWAENIRWAKEQYRMYGSVWTEYEYALECITEHRRSTFWVSEEVLRGWKLPGQTAAIPVEHV